METPSGQSGVIRVMQTGINNRRATLDVTIEKYIIRGGKCMTTVCQQQVLGTDPWSSVTTCFRAPWLIYGNITNILKHICTHNIFFKVNVCKFTVANLNHCHWKTDIQQKLFLGRDVNFCADVKRKQHLSLVMNRVSSGCLQKSHFLKLWTWPTFTGASITLAKAINL